MTVAQEHRERRRAEVRRRIQEVALRLFTQRGHERVRIEQIAREVGASVGLIYLHFRSKDDLLVSLVEFIARPPQPLWHEIIAKLASRSMDALSTQTVNAAKRALGEITVEDQRRYGSATFDQAAANLAAQPS